VKRDVLIAVLGTVVLVWFIRSYCMEYSRADLDGGSSQALQGR
jgi:hypothetical protein